MLEYVIVYNPNCWIFTFNPYLPALPSAKRLHNYGKSPFVMGKSTISMAMFNSYDCLPEGI